MNIYHQPQNTRHLHIYIYTCTTQLHSGCLLVIILTWCRSWPNLFHTGCCTYFGATCSDNFRSLSSTLPHTTLASLSLLYKLRSTYDASLSECPNQRTPSMQLLHTRDTLYQCACIAHAVSVDEWWTWQDQRTSHIGDVGFDQARPLYTDNPLAHDRGPDIIVIGTTLNSKGARR